MHFFGHSPRYPHHGEKSRWRQIVWPIITQSTLEVEQGTMIFAMMDEASADDDDDHHHLVDIPHHLLRQNHHRGGVTIVELLGARQVHHFILI